MINQPGSETIDSSMTPPPKDVLSYSVSQNPVASELDGDSIDSSIQNALTETASNESKKTPISIPVQELTPIERAVNEYAKINNARNKTALNQSLVSASAKDPDTAAKSQALATSLNVSTGVVDFDIELAKRQMLLRKAEAIKLAEKYPSLAKMFLNQDFAEVAHDDIDNLAKTSDISRRLIATNNASSDSFPLEFDPIRTANYYATNTLEGFKSDWERGYKSGDITDRSSKLGYSAFTSPGSELRDAYIFQAENLKSKTEEYLGTWTESLAELAGQLAPMTVEAAATGVVASGGTALVASIFPPAEIPLVPGAFAAGFAGSISYQSFEIETGASYLDLRKGDEDYEPMSHEEAAAIAPTIGLINAVLETSSTFYFFIPGATLAKHALKKIVKETVSKSLRKATVGKLARSAAVRVLKTGTLETVTEVLQTIVPKIVREANVPEGRMSAFDTEEGRKRFADEIAVTIEKTFKGAFLLGLIPGGAKFIHERSILNESIEQQNDITNHIDNAKESKVNKRSKTTYASYLAEQLSGESLHIGVEQFEQARRKNGVGLQEVEKIIPGITEQVAKAKASGGDVVIPTSLYLSELIDTEFGVSIRNDIRADAEGKSINDIAEDEISRKEFLKELKQEIEDFKKTNKDWAESAGNIEEEVFAKIKAAGNYTEEEARMLAQFHRDIAVVLASRFRMTPEQFNAKFGLSIESAYTPEQQAPAQGSFEQAQIAKMDSDYMAAVESGNVVEQQRMVDEAAKSAGYTIPVYHFTDKEFTAFDIEKGQAGPGIWLTASPEGWYGKNRLNLYLNPGKIQTVKSQFDKSWRKGELSIEGILEGDLDTISQQNIDTLKNEDYTAVGSGNTAFYVATRSEQVKSSDPITRDESGKVVPLSRRFNLSSPNTFEQASRADLGLGQQAAPAPDIGVFDANNPPVSSEAIFALMDADGKIYYDINATMHGDLVETFPDITDTVIDGGFIVNGKYMMGKSDGGYSAFEGEQKQIDAVRNFTEQANTQGFQESNYRLAVVAWAKERFGDRTAPDGSTVWQNFTEWFGDSKVVDAEGKPMVVYHGGEPGRTVFADTGGRVDSAYKQGTLHSQGIWLTKNRGSDIAPESGRSETEAMRYAENYAGGVAYPLYVTIKNPAQVDDRNIVNDSVTVESLKAQGHDGAFLTQSRVWVAFEPTQIKSAIANTGEFSATDPNILRQAAVRQTPMPSVTTTNPVSPIGLAIASIPASGPKSIADSNTFFKKVWKKLLIATGKQIRSKSDDSVKAAAKLAVADIQDFLKGNTQFLDYYSQDWIKTKQLLDNYAGRPITNDEFQMYRIISGLTSPNTKLPSNISDTVKLWTHWMNKGSFDDFLLGSKPITKTLVVFESAESVSGTTANVKIRTIKIVADLTKKLGSVKAAIDYLREPVTVKELHAVNKTLGYAGNVSNIGNIRSLVQMATGQDTLIPRMFIFGQKVGAYALNSIGDERFTTVDIWESRYIRSFFSGMFENEIGLPVDEKEHNTFVRFGYAFKDEMERVTGRTWTPSSLQALRWFYIIAATRAAGYSKASTSETISTYTNRVLQSTFDYDQSRETNATKSITTPPRRIEPKKYERDIGRDLDAKGITDPKQRQRITQQSWIQFARGNSGSDPMGFQFDTNRSGVSRRSGTLSGLATVATHTPGVRLVDALTKAGVSAQPYVELEPTAEGVKTFSDLVRKVNANSKFGTAVYVYSDADYAKKRLFISESGKSGFALSPDGDIVSVFSESGSREGRGAMILATQMGGTKLDCFDTILPGYYAAHGFRAVARVPWNDEFIPAGWDFDAFGQYNGGRPDVVYMVYEEKYSKPYSNTDGVVVSNPDEAVAIQTKDIKTEADRAATSKARYAQLVRPPSTEFAQSAQNKPARGFFNPKQLKMMLGSKSDFTTFIHELAHYNLTVLGRIASDPQSPSQIREDMDTTLSWFGIAGETPEQRLANWNAMTLEEQRRHHETFAYNHEIYLSEGKSPSIEMQGVFERFSQFVKRIYISIRDDLNAIYKQEFGTDLPMMTGEIRRVMDRMIATDEQIRSAEERRNMEDIFKDQELSGMDDAQWASYQQMRAEATQKSVSELNEQSLAATTWASRLKAKKVKEIEAEQEELRSEIRKQVKKEVESRNVYRAIKFLKYGILQTAGGEEVEFTGSNKLNTNAVKLMVPKENMDKFGSGKNGMVALDGYHPDIVSEMFNYSSGDELILAILDAKPMDEVIDGITEDRMEIENGELNSPQAIEAAADKAVHNEARVKLVAVELRWLTKATQPVRAMIAAAKSVAKQMLETKRLRDIKPGDYASAAARAAKESQTAYFASQSAETAAKTAYTRHYNKMIAEGVEETKAVEMATKVSDEARAKAESRSEAHKKKYGKMKPSEVAAQAKRSQLLQEQLALEAKEVKDEIKSQIKKFKRFFENDKKIAKTRNMDLVNAARSILAFYGLGKHNKLPSAYLEQLKEYNPNLFETVFAMVTRAQVGTPDYQSLTVEEFRSMKETVDALWELANRENQIRVEGKVILVNQAVDELNARLDKIGVSTKIVGETQAVTGKDRLVRHINSTKAILRRVQNWADATDGANNVVGPFTKYIWRPISQALNAYRIDRNKYVKRYVELLKEIALPVGKIVAPELNYTFGADNGGIGIAELLGAIMHSGNISNLEKLLIGRKWATVSEDGTMDTSRWYAFVARVTNDGTLTKQHFDFIQATWDLNEELKPMAQKAHHDIEGYYFKEVEATPFTNQFGTYRGGYVPAKTDPFIVRDAQRQAKMSELESDFRAAMPSTGAGFTESRVKYNKPLSLDIRLIAKHIDDVIRYSHVQPAVKDVMRILNKRSFADKLTRMDSMAIDEMIIPWLNRSARQITSDPGRSKWVDNFWRTIRSRTGMAIMIGNIRNALQQPTGLFMSATKVKPSNLGNAFLAYLSSPHKTAQEVSSLSSFMSNKLENQIFDLQNAMNELLLNPNAYKKIERWTLHHAYFLQSAFQNMADIVTWVGAYNQYLEESGVGVSNADAQKEAVNRADAAVQLTQGTRNPESIAAFEVGTPFYQTFIQFTGYYSMLANLNTDEYVKIFRDLGWRGNKGKLVYTFLMGFAAQAIVSDAIVRTLGGDWEDDDDDGYLDVVMDWIFGSMARSAVAMVPFGSSAYTALTTAYNNKPYDDRITSSPSISALESSTVGVGKAIINVVSEDKEITGQNVKDVATLISVSTGIPMTLLGRPASYLVDVERGAVEPTSTADLVRGLITGTASKESKKR